MLKHFNTLILVFCFLGSAGQQALKPSGKRPVVSPNFVDSLISECSNIYRREPARAKQLIKTADSLAQLTNDKKHQATVTFWKCRLGPTDHTQQIECYKRVLEAYKSTGNEANMGEVYYHLGNAYDRLATERNKASNSAEALQHYFTALKYFDKYPNPSLTAIAYANIGGFYLEIKDPKCVEYFEKGISIRMKLVDSARLFNDFGNLGVAYSIAKDYKKAIEYTSVAVRISQKGQQKRNEASWRANLANFLLNASETELKTLQMTPHYAWQSAVAQVDIIRPLLQDMKAPPVAFLETDLLLGEAYVKLKQFDKAVAHLTAAMSFIQHSPNPEQRLGFYEILSEAYAGLHQPDSAYFYARLMPPIKDSLNQNDLRRVILKKEVDYEFTRIETALKEANSIALAQLREQQLISQKQQQEINLKQALLELNAKQKEINRLAFLQADAELRTTKFNKDEQEKQLTIANQEKDLQTGKLRLQQSQLNLQQQEIQAQKKSQLYIVIGFVLLVLLASAMIINYKNKQKAKAMLEAEKQKTQKAETVRRMAEFEMHGLRAQLNPHFMFNSLNAIQEQILKEANDKASDYLTIFARMLRQLLDNAERSFLSLDKEIEFLQLYLFMEKLRMADLEYDIQIDPALKTQEIMIPNMILQPYLENAIWHGLSLKKGERRILLTATSRANSVLLTIEDNGIGREQAAILNKKYRKMHQSKGMELLRKRFNLMKVEYGSDIGVAIIDLHENNAPSGTRVELSIPYTLSGKMDAMLSTTIHNN